MSRLTLPVRYLQKADATSETRCCYLYFGLIRCWRRATLMIFEDRPERHPSEIDTYGCEIHAGRLFGSTDGRTTRWFVEAC